MATRSTAFTPGTPSWVDLMTSDVDGATAFYSGLFGWTSEAAGEEMGGYVRFFKDGADVAGMMGKTPEMGDMPDVWSTYLSSDDAEATVAAATAAGAQVIVPTMDVGDLGRMAVLIDPAGAAIGVWQPGTFTGFGRYNEPGSVVWDEHHSKDFAASSTFYTDVFGYQLTLIGDTSDFRYATASVGGDMVAGLMDSVSFLPPEVPSHWAVYFNVADVDESVAKAVELGATVLRPAEDTPFGRMVDLLDPTGAAFKLQQAPPE